jgi:hypothetical protein
MRSKIERVKNVSYHLSQGIPWLFSDNWKIKINRFIVDTCGSYRAVGR